MERTPKEAGSAVSNYSLGFLCRNRGKQRKAWGIELSTTRIQEKTLPLKRVL